MKKLIVFATRHGSVRNAVDILKEAAGSDTVVADLQRDSVPDPTDFDSVMIGGSIYMGKIQKEVMEFCSGFADSLKAKDLGVFICAGEENEEKRSSVLKKNIPSQLLDHARAVGWFGHEVHMEDMGILEKLALRFAKGVKESYSSLNEENIRDFASRMGLA